MSTTTPNRAMAKEMFTHGYNGYMAYAFPSDELGPISCSPIGRDVDDPDNFGRNDIMGNYLLTLVDSLDAIAIISGKDAIEKAVALTIKFLDLDSDNQVQVFESNIRILGGLLSAHIFATDPRFNFTIDNYEGQLLTFAEDLGSRLLPAFRNKRTGIPFARTNLRYGPSPLQAPESCSAGAGTLLLEFGTLSRLTGNPAYEEAARIALMSIWDRRSALDLVGSSINVLTGNWISNPTGVGAGIDSLFEYMIKSAILFDDNAYMNIFDTAYRAILKHVRDPSGYFYLNIDMDTAKVWTPWIDSLAAFLPGMQVLIGDLESAIRGHFVYQNIWYKYGALPERFNYQTRKPEITFYPLRPEHAESTYFLYLATRDPMYLEMGARILEDINRRARTSCGFASIANILSGKLDDRQESFFLSETLKYLYLLFDADNPLNTMDGSFVFTTEAHILALPRHLTLNKTQEPLSPSVPNMCQRYKRGTLFGVRSRTDADWVRAVIGYYPDTQADADLLHWDPHLICVDPSPPVSPKKASASIPLTTT